MTNFKMYFHGKDKDDNRYTLAAIESDGIIKFGSAVCSKKDNFSKKIGRLIAEGRAKTKPITTLENIRHNRNKEDTIELRKKVFNVFSIVDNIAKTNVKNIWKRNINQYTLW